LASAKLERDRRAFGNDGLQVLCVPWLADEAVDLAFVDRADDGGEVGIAGQQNAHALRRNLARLAQQLDACITGMR
jgi:hypothetical protein